MENAALQKIPAIKKIYRYQKIDIQNLFSRLESAPAGTKILYQLPTGGGKTVIFSEIAKNYIGKYARQVVVLTHRIELCRQTNNVLKRLGIRSMEYTSEVKKRPKVQPDCYVAMIETLKNRLRDKQFNPDTIGLVIIDEAHHNSFRKLLGNFRNAVIVGVTATPLSSDATMPLNEHYSELIVGEDIRSLISQGFLAKPKTFSYPVELNSLVTAHHGDYTVASSDMLFGSEPMLDLLLQAYRQHCSGKKTLIFNNGILTSKKVLQMITAAGYPVRHLDNKTPKAERIAILKWFRQTKGAILTSVSLLTTGFDEPSIQTVILYRATNSLTLYHQMIGRGSRTTSNKKTFSIIDLGNNTERFGEWDAPLDWRYIFENPEDYISKSVKSGGHDSHAISAELRALFPKTLELSFDIRSAYLQALEDGKKPRTVMRDCIRQHALMCIGNADTASEALHLSDALQAEIAWRVKQYCKCLENTTKNYAEWLQQDYKMKLRAMIQKLMYRITNANGTG
jgi:superfamily II DNA or RNA helicase